MKGLPEGQEVEMDESIYKLIAREGANSLIMDVRHVKTAAAGAFIVPEKFEFKLAYSLLNKISKNPRGKKFISKSDIILELNGEHYQWKKLDCIDEYVFF